MAPLLRSGPQPASPTPSSDRYGQPHAVVGPGRPYPSGRRIAAHARTQ
ncbi:MAG TPA: hypothetical protein VGN49_01085 [Micrococcaceae bacterium]|nr:hypothetical protein [Micrococcaceae bacterium]